MDDYAVGRFKAFYNFILYGYGRMDRPQMVNSSCRNNQEQEDGYNAGIAEIAFNRKDIEAYITRRAIEDLNTEHNPSAIIINNIRHTQDANQ